MKRIQPVDVGSAIVLASTFNFLWCCAKGCVLPFLTLYLRHLGLTPAMTGVVMGTKHLVVLVWSPVAGLLSKTYNKRRTVINVALVCSGAIALILVVFPSAKEHWQSGCDVSQHLSPSLSQNPSLSPDLGQSSGPSLSPDLDQSPGPSLNQSQILSLPSPGPRQNQSQIPSLQSPGPSPGDIQHVGNGTVTALPPLRGPTVQQTSRSSFNASSHPQSHLPSSTVANVPHAEPRNGSYATQAKAAQSARNKRSEVTAEAQSLQGDSDPHEDFLGNLKVMDTQHQLFFLMLIFICVWEAVTSPLEWTADDGLYEYLDSVDASDRYGSTEPWGLLGGACGAGGAGLLISQLSCIILGGTYRGAVHFYGHAAVAALALPVALYLPLHLNKKRDKATGLLRALQLVRGHPRALLCAVTVFVAGAATAAVDDFLLWQMQDHGSDELHMGACLAAGLLSHMTYGLLATRVARVLSPGRVLTLGTVILAAQCLYYSFLWGPWAALPAQLLSCLGSGTFWWAVRQQCEDVATLGAEKSVRRVYGAICLELGRCLGSFGGGFLVQRFGLDWLFRAAAAAMTAWCVCLPVLQWKAPRQRRINYSRLLAAEGSEASDSESEQERDWLAKAMEGERSSNNNNIH